MPTTVPGFDNIRFPISISVGASGGEEMQTTVHITASGYEQRNADWNEVRGQWDVSSNVKTLAQSALLIAFFRARRGMTFTFRWQPLDILDRTAVASAFGIGNGVRTVFPLYKTYPDSISPQTRRIVLPIDSGVYTTDTPFAIYDNASLVNPADYTTDFRNGRITFDTAPTDTHILTWDGEFDIPARFGVPRLTRTMITHEIVSYEQVTIIEVLPQEILETADV